MDEQRQLEPAQQRVRMRQLAPAEADADRAVERLSARPQAERRAEGQHTAVVGGGELGVEPARQRRRDQDAVADTTRGIVRRRIEADGWLTGELEPAVAQPGRSAAAGERVEQLLRPQVLMDVDHRPTDNIDKSDRLSNV